MDPVTAAINAFAAFLKFQNDVFDALPAEDKTKYAQRWAADQQAWRDWWSNAFALVKK